MARNEIEHIHAEPTYGFSAKPSVSLALFLNCLKARMWNTGTVILEKKKENASDVEWRMCQAVLKTGVHTDIKRWIFNSIQRGKPSIAKLSNLIPFDKSTLVLNKTSILNTYKPAFPRFSYKKYCLWIFLICDIFLVTLPLIYCTCLTLNFNTEIVETLYLACCGIAQELGPQGYIYS